MDITKIPFISMEDMVKVDRLMVDHYGIQLVQMMENAGRHLAELAREHFLTGDAREKRVYVLAGSGGNGGGAMVCARNLHNWGAEVSLFLTRSVDQLSDTILHQARIIQGLDMIISSTGQPDPKEKSDLIIDGIIGYSLEGAPRGRAAELIVWANGQNSPILSLDVPSGLHASSGEVFSPVINATATMTLALPKLGLKNPTKPVVGDLYLADIGVPTSLYSDPLLDLEVGPIFSDKSIIQLL